MLTKITQNELTTKQADTIKAIAAEFAPDVADAVKSLFQGGYTQDEISHMFDVIRGL